MITNTSPYAEQPDCPSTKDDEKVWVDNSPGSWETTKDSRIRPWSASGPSGPSSGQETHGRVTATIIGRMWSMYAAGSLSHWSSSQRAWFIHVTLKRPPLFKNALLFWLRRPIFLFVISHWLWQSPWIVGAALQNACMEILSQTNQPWS